MKKLENSICKELWDDIKDIADNNCSQIKNSKILITGASGFIAYYIVLSLLANNDINSASNKLLLLVRNHANAKQMLGDLLKREDVELIIQDVCEPFDSSITADYIIHAAGYANAEKFEKDPIGTYTANVVGTENILKLAEKSISKSVAYISSFMVYGKGTDSIENIDETYHGTCDFNTYKNCYGYGKRSGEIFCQCYYKQKNIPVKIIRPGFIYGASTKDDMRVYAEIIRKVSMNKVLLLKSDGHIYRSMCYVTDLVRGIFCILVNGENGQAYNISSSHTSIRQFAQAAIDINPMSKLIFENSDDENILCSEKIYGALDITKLQILGWKPKHSIKCGIKEASAIYRSKYHDLLRSSD